MSKYWSLRSETATSLECVLTGPTIAFANAIRRIALTDIETFAIDQADVHLDINTTPLHNEIIGHRISILPLRQDAEDLEDLVFYVCKKDSKDAPFENTKDEIIELSTRDVMIYNPKTMSWVDPMAVFTDDFLITKLNLKQKIHGTFKARRGTAKEHSRWCPVSTIAYRYMVSRDLKDVPYDQISLEEERDVILNRSNDPAGFIFVVETAGVMTPREVIRKALECLIGKLDVFKKTIESGKGVQWIAEKRMLQIDYKGETHTLGNLITSFGLEVLDDDDFLGYRTIHPMFDQIIIRYSSATLESLKEHVDSLLKIVDMLEENTMAILDRWNTAQVYRKEDERKRPGDN